MRFYIHLRTQILYHKEKKQTHSIMERSNDVNKSAINEKAKEYKNTINIIQE